MVTDINKYFNKILKLSLIITFIVIISGCCQKINAQKDNCLGSGISLSRDVVIIDTLSFPDGVRIMRFVQFDTIKYAKHHRKDTIWGQNLQNYATYNRIEMGKRMNNGIKYIDKSKRNFWAGNLCMISASAFYITAAWNDPIIYIESTKQFTWDYYHNAKFQRDVKIIGGVAFTGLAVYFYYKMYKNGKKSKWYISPDGIRYNF